MTEQAPKREPEEIECWGVGGCHKHNSNDGCPDEAVFNGVFPDEYYAQGWGWTMDHGPAEQHYACPECKDD